MTNIPEDIMAKAQEIVPSVHWTSWATGDEIAEIIAAALLSERTAQEAEIARLTAMVVPTEAAAKVVRKLHKERDDAYRDLRSVEHRMAAAEARVAKLEKGLNLIDALDPEEQIDRLSHDATQGLVIQMGRYARAALTPVKENTDVG